MRYLKIICILFLVFGCQKADKKHIAIGTWYKCLEDGNYTEYRITDKYVINLTTRYDDVWLFKNKTSDNTLILSNFKTGPVLLTNNDTLVAILQSKNKIVLKSTSSGNKLELNKIEFDYDEIDSTNLKLWKSKTLSDFKKRAKLAGCTDLQTDEKKETPSLDENEVEETTPTTKN
ncbi:hypothetical protein [Olleya sp. Bg11-27]|uniref:hypothetical protein n=1 Tax=Olleya sp. Bg11-27 TaxID=2058135 RepID=UPI000C30D751|nr:hypothetical protein [Olleya sp. Bg11-27]AUC75529.1 hypothetical protein CW732_07515 [Olleya sp. Bg11-27]